MKGLLSESMTGEWHTLSRKRLAAVGENALSGLGFTLVEHAG